MARYGHRRRAEVRKDRWDARTWRPGGLLPFAVLGTAPDRLPSMTGTCGDRGAHAPFSTSVTPGP